MDELTKILAEATAGIEDGYFHLNIDGGDPVYRERVYCYELYHQMRLGWPTNCPFYLNGEIDKAAHPILTKLGAAHTKPDLLVHRPGYMSGNHAIIEVKSSRAPNAGIQKDLATLSLFRSVVKYERAIYLVYGNEVDCELVARINHAATETKGLAPIEVWIHLKAGKPAAHAFNVD